MLKKEFRDTVRILIESSLLLLAVPLIILSSFIMGFKLPVGELIKYDAIVTIFAFAGYSGIGMFLWEKRDNGLEYLLTLPVSKFKLFVYKIFPRIIILLILIMSWSLIFDVSIKNLVVVLIFIQFAGVSLSLAFNSYFAAFISIFLLGFIYSFSQKFLVYFYSYLKEFTFNANWFIPTHLMEALLIGIPLAVSFFLAYKSLDLKPYKYTLKPYLYIAFPLILAQVIIIFYYYERVVFN